MKKIVMAIALLTACGCGEPTTQEFAVSGDFYEVIAGDGSHYGYKLLIVTNPQTRKRYLVLTHTDYGFHRSLTKLADLDD